MSNESRQDVRQAELRWKLLADNAYFIRGLVQLSRRSVPTVGRPAWLGGTIEVVDPSYLVGVTDAAIAAFQLPSDVAVPLAEALDAVLDPNSALRTVNDKREYLREFLPIFVSSHRSVLNGQGEEVSDPDARQFPTLVWYDDATGVTAAVSRPHTVHVEIDNIHGLDREELDRVLQKVRLLIRVLQGDMTLSPDEVRDVKAYPIREIMPLAPKHRAAGADGGEALVLATADYAANPYGKADPHGRGHSNLQERLAWHWRIKADHWTPRQVAEYVTHTAPANESHQLPSEDTIRRRVAELDEILRPSAPWPTAE